MLMNASILEEKHRQGSEYEAFVASGEPEGHRPQWDQRYGQLALTAGQTALVESFDREMNVLCLTGTWCGDCALQGAAMPLSYSSRPVSYAIPRLSPGLSHPT